MTQSASAARANFSWRNIDIIIAAVIGVAVGLIFVIWNIIGGAGYEAVNALTPGLGGLVAGMWFLGGPLGAYIIRKPGAAIFVEVIAATVSALIGNQWGISTLYSGLAQGLGAELVFLILAYKSYNLATVVISGLMAGVGAWTFELFTGNLAKTFEFNVIYLISTALSGAVLAGLLAYFLAKALAATGALDRFVIGRERHDDV
ncbi:ECF transporter S component [Corynebacterium sp. 5QC2CO]|uniref:ECF transporter S component n=1 Tax=Corynebacterium sp. 5QC2CO TaxID=2968468 RepID=UPI00211BF2B7|nr:ECF transporter S component [Corynebacterium sp. 5QC2CO]MCQ9349504.1 ECF transporter S component [Corynebacterium sp. 5QC2CO]